MVSSVVGRLRLPAEWAGLGEADDLFGHTFAACLTLEKGPQDTDVAHPNTTAWSEALRWHVTAPSWCGTSGWRRHGPVCPGSLLSCQRKELWSCIFGLLIKKTNKPKYHSKMTNVRLKVCTWLVIWSSCPDSIHSGQVMNVKWGQKLYTSCTVQHSSCSYARDFCTRI